MRGHGVEKLTDLPNIGTVLAERLCQAGIETPAELAGLGSVEALRRVRRACREDLPCRNMLCALEGAIRGIRWHGIPVQERDELWHRYRNQLGQ
jgi:DNA transformation protein